LGGDWNDNWAPHELGSGLHEWANQYQLTSPHHQLGGDHLPYTWKRGERESRLDYILIPKVKIGWIQYALTVDDENNHNIDHRPVLISLERREASIALEQLTRFDSKHNCKDQETHPEVMLDEVNMQEAHSLP